MCSRGAPPQGPRVTCVRAPPAPSQGSPWPQLGAGPDASCAACAPSLSEQGTPFPSEVCAIHDTGAHIAWLQDPQAPEPCPCPPSPSRLCILPLSLPPHPPRLEAAADSPWLGGNRLRIRTALSCLWWSLGVCREGGEGWWVSPGAAQSIGQLQPQDLRPSSGPTGGQHRQNPGLWSPAEVAEKFQTSSLMGGHASDRTSILQKCPRERLAQGPSVS